MSHKEKKSLLRRAIEREELNLAEYSFEEIEKVIRELAEYYVDKVRAEEAIRLRDAMGVAADKVKSLLKKEVKA